MTLVPSMADRGAHVTMVQRSPTMVTNVEPSAQLYDGLYLGDGPPIEDRDLINTSVPFDVMVKAHKLVTEQVKELDRETLEGLLSKSTTPEDRAASYLQMADFEVAQERPIDAMGIRRPHSTERWLISQKPFTIRPLN